MEFKGHFDCACASCMNGIDYIRTAIQTFIEINQNEIDARFSPLAFLMVKHSSSDSTAHTQVWSKYCAK